MTDDAPQADEQGGHSFPAATLPGPWPLRPTAPTPPGRWRTDAAWDALMAERDGAVTEINRLCGLLKRTAAERDAARAEIARLQAQLARSIQTPPTDPLGPPLFATARDDAGRKIRVIGHDYEWGAATWWVTIITCDGAGVPWMVRDTELAAWNPPPAKEPPDA